jgi:hypothetical protein
MPIAVPELPDAEYTLPVAMGRLFDSTILSNSALWQMHGAKWQRLICFVLELLSAPFAQQQTHLQLSVSASLSRTLANKSIQALQIYSRNYTNSARPSVQTQFCYLMGTTGREGDKR